MASVYLPKITSSSVLGVNLVAPPASASSNSISTNEHASGDDCYLDLLPAELRERIFVLAFDNGTMRFEGCIPALIKALRPNKALYAEARFYCEKLQPLALCKRNNWKSSVDDLSVRNVLVDLRDCQVQPQNIPMGFGGAFYQDLREPFPENVEHVRFAYPDNTQILDIHLEELVGMLIGMKALTKICIQVPGACANILRNVALLFRHDYRRYNGVNLQSAVDTILKHCLHCRKPVKLSHVDLSPHKPKFSMFVFTPDLGFEHKEGGHGEPAMEEFNWAEGHVTCQS